MPSHPTFKKKKKCRHPTPGAPGYIYTYLYIGFQVIQHVEHLVDIGENKGILNIIDYVAKYNELCSTTELTIS